MVISARLRSVEKTFLFYQAQDLVFIFRPTRNGLMNMEKSPHSPDWLWITTNSFSSTTPKYGVVPWGPKMPSPKSGLLCTHQDPSGSSGLFQTLCKLKFPAYTCGLFEAVWCSLCFFQRFRQSLQLSEQFPDESSEKVLGLVDWMLCM